MKTETRPVTETKVCYDPRLINNILARIDTDPAIAPKGIGQIEFFYNLVQVLNTGEVMDVTVERQMEVPDDEPAQPVAAPAEEGVTVWSAEDDEPHNTPEDPGDVAAADVAVNGVDVDY